MPALLHPAAKGGDPELIRESQRKRFADVSLVQKVVDLDNAWRDGEGVPCKRLQLALWGGAGHAWARGARHRGRLLRLSLLPAPALLQPATTLTT